MSLLGKLFGGARTESEKEVEKSKCEKAIEYFDIGDIKRWSDSDYKTIKKLYEALKEDNYDTYDDNSMKEAMSSLDANVYNLCGAIIEQNFMLLRKIEQLSDKIESLEIKD